MSFRPASRLQGLRPYRPRKPGPPPLHKVDANEACPDPADLARFVGTLTLETLNRYGRPYALEARLAERFRVSPDRVAVTAGVDDGLLRLCMIALESGRQALLTRPTFEMIPRYVALAEGRPVEVDWLDQPVPTDDLVAAVGPSTGIVFLVTPTSPAGEAATAETVERLAVACGRVGALLVVDHAYVEFADHDLTAMALELPNTVVARTFSKAWGLAGIRVGYLMGPAPVISLLKTVGQPYAVATPSIGMAAAALAEGEDAMLARVRRVRDERDRLTALIETLGGRPVRSEGNFVLARLGTDAHPFGAAMAARGIAVRCFDGPGVLEGAVRISCPGDSEAFQALMSALPEALREARS